MHFLSRTFLVLVVLATGCKKDERLLAREAELAEAEKQLSALEAQHTALLAEKQSLEQRIQEAAVRHQAVKAERQHALAAAAWLREVDGKGFPIEPEMRRARLGFELQQALAAGDSARVDALMTDATVSYWDCDTPETEEEKEEEKEDPAPPDHCADVPEVVPVEPRWTCERIQHEGAPAVAFCTADVTYEPLSAKADKEVGYGSTTRTLVRVAFAHEGQLHVSDADPSPESFVSTNFYARDICSLENDVSMCRSHCEEDGDECDCTPEMTYAAMATLRLKEERSLERSPAPGVFVVRVQSRFEGPAAREEDEDSVPEPGDLQVLADRALVRWRESGSPPEGGEASLEALEVLGAFEREVAWAELPESGHAVLMGFAGGSLEGMAFNPSPKEVDGEREQVVEKVGPGTLCSLILKAPDRFPETLPAWCREKGHGPSEQGTVDAGGTP
jgi:hypothetical protein